MPTRLGGLTQSAMRERVAGTGHEIAHHPTDNPVISPSTNDVCTSATPVCTLTIVVCNVTQALGRFTYAYWRRANIVCKPANIVCGPGRGRPRLKPGLGHPSLKRHRFSCRLANLTSGCAYLIIAIVQLLPILAHTSHFSRPSEHASTTPSTRARAGVWRTTIAGGAVGLSPDERRSRHRCTMPQ